MSVFLQEFSSVEDIEAHYSCTVPKSAEILLAWYGYGSYCGSSFVLYRDNGKLYEVSGSHCSCDGLGGQWDPEETTVAALKMRGLYTDSGNYYDGEDEAHRRFVEVVDSLDNARS